MSPPDRDSGVSFLKMLREFLAGRLGEHSLFPGVRWLWGKGQMYRATVAHHLAKDRVLLASLVP